MEQKIREILKKHGNLTEDVENLKDDNNLYEAGLASHSSVNVMLALETEFNIEFPDEVLSKQMFASIANMKSVIEKVLNV